MPIIVKHIKMYDVSFYQLIERMEVALEMLLVSHEIVSTSIVAPSADEVLASYRGVIFYRSK